VGEIKIDVAELNHNSPKSQPLPAAPSQYARETTRTPNGLHIGEAVGKIAKPEYSRPIARTQKARERLGKS
jgi:hypothetical protein